MTKEQTKRDLYDNPEKTAFAMRPESETLYNQVCKIDKQTNWDKVYNWIKEYNKENEEDGSYDRFTDKPHRAYSDVADYVVELVSQEKEKWVEEIEEIKIKEEECYGIPNLIGEEGKHLVDAQNLTAKIAFNQALDKAINLLQNK